MNPDVYIVDGIEWYGVYKKTILVKLCSGTAVNADKLLNEAANQPLASHFHQFFVIKEY